MSLAIMWAPVEPGDRVVTGGASRVWCVLKELAEVPASQEEVVLDPRHIGGLRALQMVEPNEGAWSELIYAIHNAGRIRVFTEV